jgi:hypothetical protein
MRYAITFIVTAGLLFAAGCGEPTRDDRVMDIAEAGCDRFDACGEIGEGERYSSRSECLSELEGDFYTLWPADTCDAGQINEAKFNSCVVDAQNFPCDSNAFDTGGFALECRAGNVCIDPRD